LRANWLAFWLVCASGGFASLSRAGDFPVTFYLAWGERGADPDQFMDPAGVGHDDEGYIYVSEKPTVPDSEVRPVVV
jgi:hypothetical protein